MSDVSPLYKPCVSLSLLMHYLFSEYKYLDKNLLLQIID